MNRVAPGAPRRATYGGRVTSRRVAALATVVLCALAGCSSGTGAARTSPPAPPPAPSTASSSTAPVATPTPTPSTSAAPSTPATTTHRRTSAPAPSTTTHHTRAHVVPAHGAPVIVLDPGHSVAVSATDPATGLDVSDYENEPEMRDVFAVAELVRTALEARGYRVIMTKTSLDQRRSLGQRAEIARDAHADLALSIHDQAGSNGGIGFRAGNNIVYYQSVGTYRSTPGGKRVYFTDASLAATSKRYGTTFRTQRERVEGTSVRLQGDTGYDLGGRGLAGGDIWMVQLLSHVPWIYNESGGNSAGRTGLSDADEHTYAAALVAGVEHCIAPPH